MFAAVYWTLSLKLHFKKLGTPLDPMEYLFGIDGGSKAILAQAMLVRAAVEPIAPAREEYHSPPLVWMIGGGRAAIARPCC